MNLPSHQLSMTVLMTPDTANFSGNVHGGTILKLLDQAAYACASRYAGRYVVTMSVDQVTFRQPIHVGELVTFLAAVNFTGRSSMESPGQEKAAAISSARSWVSTSMRKNPARCSFPSAYGPSVASGAPSKVNTRDAAGSPRAAP